MAKKQQTKAAGSAAEQALEFVRERVETASSWTEVHNAFYGMGGRFGTLFPSQSERVAFSKTPEFGEIGRLIRSLPF